MSIARNIKFKAIKVMLLIGVVLYAGSVFSDTPATITAKDMQSRLGKLSQKLEQKRQELHIPGMAIAVVKGNKVIMAEGFGLSDLEKNIKVTPETLFAIGSTSKAFTATLVGMQVDDKKMAWDAPITDYISYLKYSLADKDEQVTIRDMLSHRSGFTRNDILWANGKVDRDTILRASINAEPYSGYHEKFNYNNVMFLGVGVASAQQSKTDWDSLLEARLLKPLGMSNTTSRFDQAQLDPNLSQGYIWREESKDYQHQTMQDLTNIAPAGAINSNVLDMAKWLKFQLNNGVVDGKRLISEEALKETHTPQISLAKSIHYGLGWFVREWNGQPVIEHGGNIAGFGAQVAFLPESNLGFVLLTNVTATPLQQASMNIVWDTLLGDEKPQDATKVASNVSGHDQYFGDYIANFGPFKDATFTVSDTNGTLHVNVPGQTNYALKEPNEKGLWLFELTDTISVSFDKDANGHVTAMRMQQAGMNFEIPRKGVVIKPEIDPQALQPFIGSYQSDTFKGIIKAVIQNHRLALDVPGQMVFELQLPNDKQERLFRINADMKAVFDKNKSEQVTAIKIYKGEQLIDTATRIESEVEVLPTLDDILALRKTEQRKKAYAKAGNIELNGKVNFVHSGLVGKIQTAAKGKDSLLVNMDLGDYGYIRTAFNSDGGASDGIQQYRELQGKYLDQARADHFAADVDWRDFYQSIKVTGSEVLGESKAYRVQLKNEGLPTVVLYVDAKTGDVLKRKSSQLVPIVGSIPMTYTFSDYRDIDGLRIPFKSTMENQMMGKLVMELDTVDTNVDIPADKFVVKESD